MAAAALTALLAVAVALLLRPGDARAHEDTTPLTVSTVATDAAGKPRTVTSAIEAKAAFTTAPPNNGDTNSNGRLFRGQSLANNVEEGFYRVQVRKRLVGGEVVGLLPAHGGGHHSADDNGEQPLPDHPRPESRFQRHR